MHIAVDAHHIKAVVTEEKHHTMSLLFRLIQSGPEHHFTIISSQSGLLPAWPNLTEQVTTTPLNSYLRLWRWYNKTLPEILGHAKADVLISINGAVGKLSIPRITFLSSPNATEESFTGKLLFLLYKRYVNRHIAKADAIVTFTHLQQIAIAKHLNVKADQITPVGYAVPSVFKPADWQQKEIILEEHTNGSEYFLYAGSFSEDTFLFVLKAFSLFKKRQLSTMKLIAAGNFTLSKDLAEKLATYKYRADVKLYENTDQQMRASLTSAAYAVIYLNEKALTAFPAAAALPCELPVIGLANTAVEDVAASAGLYASPTPESLAEQMKVVYKDENLRRQLIANAAMRLPIVNGAAAVQKLWNCIDVTTAKIRLHLPPENEKEI